MLIKQIINYFSKKIKFDATYRHPGFYKNQQKIIDWLEEQGIKKYLIKQDLTVNLRQDLILNGYQKSFLPVKFNIILGNVMIKDSKLKSLEGLGWHISGNLSIENSDVESLNKIGVVLGNIDIRKCNKITSLQGLPSFLCRGVYVSEVPIKNLKGCPPNVEVLEIKNCGLTSLEGLKDCKVKKSIDLSHNNLLSLDKIVNCPIIIASHNPLENLSALKKVNFSFFYFDKNNVKNLKEAEAFELNACNELFLEKKKFELFINKEVLSNKLTEKPIRKKIKI